MPTMQAEPPSSKTPNPAAAIQIEVKPGDPKPRMKGKRYLCGVALDAPFTYKCVGGISFQKWEGQTQFDSKGKLTTPAKLGCILELADEQVKIAKEAISNHYIQVTQGPRGGEAGAENVVTLVRDFVTTDETYEPQDGDKPLGWWLYMLPVFEQMPVTFREEQPPTMVRRE